MGAAGVAKNFLAQALVYSAISAGHTVLVILGEHGLHGLTAQQSADFYELILNRHRASSSVITGNRAVDEWISNEGDD